MMIKKTLAYQAKSYGRTAVFVSDKFDGVVSFKDISIRLSNSLLRIGHPKASTWMM